MNIREINEEFAKLTENEKTYYLYAGYDELYLTDHELTAPYMYQAENTNLNQLINDNISDIDENGEWENPDAAFSTDSASILFDKSIIDEINDTDLFAGYIDRYHDELTDAEFNGKSEEEIAQSYHIVDLSDYYKTVSESINETSYSNLDAIVWDINKILNDGSRAVLKKRVPKDLKEDGVDFIVEIKSPNCLYQWGVYPNNEYLMCNWNGSFSVKSDGEYSPSKYVNDIFEKYGYKWAK